MLPSDPLASASGMEHHHPILGTLGGHEGQVNIERYFNIKLLVCVIYLNHILFASKILRLKKPCGSTPCLNFLAEH